MNKLDMATFNLRFDSKEVENPQNRQDLDRQLKKVKDAMETNPLFIENPTYKTQFCKFRKSGCKNEECTFAHTQAVFLAANRIQNEFTVVSNKKKVKQAVLPQPPKPRPVASKPAPQKQSEQKEPAKKEAKLTPLIAYFEEDYMQGDIDPHLEALTGSMVDSLDRILIPKMKPSQEAENFHIL